VNTAYNLTRIERPVEQRAQRKHGPEDYKTADKAAE
jgi:hypothetical protein